MLLVLIAYVQIVVIVVICHRPACLCDALQDVRGMKGRFIVTGSQRHKQNLMERIFATLK